MGCCGEKEEPGQVAAVWGWEGKVRQIVKGNCMAGNGGTGKANLAEPGGGGGTKGKKAWW